MFNKKQEFIEFTINENILRFGDFTLKSGRRSPYFFNTGLCNNGKLLSVLTSYYADYIYDHSLKYNFIFGPAYKGITLCSSISQSLFNKYSAITNYAFNRKEAKTHGDKGDFVGCEIKGKALIVDDVISSGSSIIESYDLLTRHDVKCTDILVAFNRMEIGDKLMASTEISNNYNIETHYLINLEDIYEYIKSNTSYKKHIQDMEEYISKYKGC
jgi:orotate phosphoribosyltransferase